MDNGNYRNNSYHINGNILTVLFPGVHEADVDFVERIDLNGWTFDGEKLYSNVVTESKPLYLYVYGIWIAYQWIKTSSIDSWKEEDRLRFDEADRIVFAIVESKRRCLILTAKLIQQLRNKNNTNIRDSLKNYLNCLRIKGFGISAYNVDKWIQEIYNTSGKALEGVAAKYSDLCNQQLIEIFKSNASQKTIERFACYRFPKWTKEFRKTDDFYKDICYAIMFDESNPSKKILLSLSGLDADGDKRIESKDESNAESEMDYIFGQKNYMRVYLSDDVEYVAGGITITYKEFAEWKTTHYGNDLNRMFTCAERKLLVEYDANNYNAIITRWPACTICNRSLKKYSNLDYRSLKMKQGLSVKNKKTMDDYAQKIYAWKYL